MFFTYCTKIFTNDKITFFVDGIQDVPLHQKMIIKENSLIMFDTNQGNLVEVEIKGDQEISNLKKFYNEVLPNLGWQMLKKDKFKRDQNFLDIEYFTEKKKTIVKFKLIQK